MKAQRNVKPAAVEAATASKRDTRGSLSLAQWANALLKPESEDCEAEACRKLQHNCAFNRSPSGQGTQEGSRHAFG